MADKKVVAIHQPNFFPWLGYFHKIVVADMFIVLDNVQFPKKGGTWSNRVRVFVSGQPAWLTIPVDRAYHGVRRINQVYLKNVYPWRNKILRTLQLNYRRAPFFEEVFPVLFELVKNATNSLAEYNLSLIRTLMKELQFDVSKMILASTLLDAKEKGTELLILLVKAVGGTAYLCGGGAEGYQEDDKFAEAGLELRYQNFQHPVYPQIHTNAFVPGLSIIDPLMNCGFKNTFKLLQSSNYIDEKNNIE